ncbi:MAG: hypothetical protein F4Y39_00500 [Gemmatimonadetes bacterium]|nr:hypothetical protein [Gemmatimonadota bacterium]MYK51416.1 hypothetical protein [Gemmatimonadota bacterium]
MSTQWLAIQSFQQSQELLSAINTLSIHRKLTDKGYLDTNRKEAAEQVVETLIPFFQKLDKIVQNIEDGPRKPVLGVDARLRHLAENYVQAKRAQSNSPFLELSLSQVTELFYSESPEDRGKVLAVLAAFRELLEEHVGVDARQLLGNI